MDFFECDITTNLALSTYLIKITENNGTSNNATGSMIRFNIENNISYFLMTNYHVIKKVPTLKIITRYLNNITKDIIFKEYDLSPYIQDFIIHTERKMADVCGLYMNNHIDHMKNMCDHNEELILRFIDECEFLSESDNISYIENIIMMGYPKDIYDTFNSLPVARSGITAGHPLIKYNGLPQFPIDCHCGIGSSGSPIISYGNPLNKLIKNGGRLEIKPRIKLLGILSNAPIIVDNAIPLISSDYYQYRPNFGLVVQVRELYNIRETFINKHT